MDRRTQMESIFLPIVKEGKLEEFKSVWGQWLCLSNTIEAEKTTGTLKVEFLSFRGRMIALCPKSYYAINYENGETKDGRKGIPNWTELELADFENTLYKKEDKEPIELRSLRLDQKTKKMTRTTTRRIGLTAIHCKLSISSDLISTSPLKRDGNLE